jgi:hypothetical protein
MRSLRSSPPAPALLPTAEQEAAEPPIHIHPFREIRQGQTVVPRGGGDPLLQVLQVPAADADALTARLVEALDGRRLPLLPAELGKHSLEAWGGVPLGPQRRQRRAVSAVSLLL